MFSGLPRKRSARFAFLGLEHVRLCLRRNEAAHSVHSLAPRGYPATLCVAGTRSGGVPIREIGQRFDAGPRVSVRRSPAHLAECSASRRVTWLSKSFRGRTCWRHGGPEFSRT